MSQPCKIEIQAFVIGKSSFIQIRVSQVESVDCLGQVEEI